MRRTYAQPPSRQRGATLIIALIFLVILSLLGATVASNNTLQERMSGNTRSRDLAFEAAEHAIRDAEIFLNNPDGDGVPANNAAYLAAHAVAGDINGLLSNGDAHDNDSTYWRDTFNWNGRIAPANLINGVNAQPSYVIERMGLTTYYRVTARGIGRSADTIAILQTMYQF